MDAPLLPALPGYDDPELIAHGTTALVFRATQRRLNRLVAIKVITVDTGSTSVNAQRELQTTVALSSQPHIVSIIDTGVTNDDRPFIVMEYCEGGSYAQILRHRGPLPVTDVIDVGVSIGEALHAAHQAGIVHRDVKPSNILRSRFGPALTDFGIARAPDELAGTLTREMMTPHHASPEALLHQAQSGPSDIYSLASTMWTLLVGHPPFVDPARPAADIYAFRDVVLYEPLPPMPRPDVPSWLVEQLTRAMAKLPAERHPTALDFAQALRRATLGIAPVGHAGTAPPTPRLARPTVHQPGLPPQAFPTSTRPSEVHPAEGPIYIPRSSAPAHPVRPQQPPMPMPPAAVSRQAPDHDRDIDDAAGFDDDAFDDLGYDGENSGGWLAPQPDPPPAPPGPAPSRPDPPRPVPTPPPAHTPNTDFGASDFTDGVPDGRRRLPMIIGSGVVMVLLAVAGLGGLLLSGTLTRPSRGDVPIANPTGDDDPTRFITPGTLGAPTAVTITKDSGESVTLRWRDPTSSTVSFHVMAYRTSNVTAFVDPQVIAHGTTRATFTGLNPKDDYCFVVSALYSTETVSRATPVCTTRRARSSPH